MDMAEIEAGQVGMRQGPPPCPNGFLYQIRAGDTLFAIAQRFGTTVTQILAANPGLDPNSLQVARLICIPRAGAPGGCPAGTSPYTIRSGDTFYSIAQRGRHHGGGHPEGQPGVNPNALRVGQVICVPGRAPDGAPGACPAGTRPYVIRSGDTFFALAQRFGVSVADLQAANPGVNPNALQIGQLVCIPTRVQTTSS